jgi:hypothetical protein
VEPVPSDVPDPPPFIAKLAVSDQEAVIGYNDPVFKDVPGLEPGDHDADTAQLADATVTTEALNIERLLVLSMKKIVSGWTSIISCRIVEAETSRSTIRRSLG